MNYENEARVFFRAKSENESFARLFAAGFFAQLDPTVSEMTDVKTVVSEAVTNAIIHGYEKEVKKIWIRCRLNEQTLYIEVEDRGQGIADVTKAMEPLFTTKPELERSGMGFSFMEAFMDGIEVDSEVGRGTIVKMQKIIGKGRKLWSTQSL